MKGAVIEGHLRTFVQAAFAAGEPEPTIPQVAIALGRAIGAEAQTADRVEQHSRDPSTIGFSLDLLAAAKLLQNRRQYRSLSEYIQGLARYDAQTQREHAFSAEWAAMNGAERDRLDAGLLALVTAGQGTRGSWLEARTYEMILQVYRPAEYEAKQAGANRNGTRVPNPRETKDQPGSTTQRQGESPS